MSPLVVCRLLLVFDYLLFQFNEPVEQLTEQVGWWRDVCASSLSQLCATQLLLIDNTYVHVCTHTHTHTHTHTQVNHNLFSSSLGGLKSPQIGGATPSLSPTPGREVMCYPCEHQLQYCMVLSKPGGGSVGGKKDVGEGKGEIDDGE